MNIFMKELDFNNLEGLKLNLTPTLSIIDDIQRQQEESLRALDSARRAKDAEELRRHNELVAALKEAGEKGATIIIGDNASDVQIQQNSTGAQQSITKRQGLDYEQVHAILVDIKEYFTFPQFEKTFGDSAESMKTMVSETIDAVDRHEDETLIKKSLRIIRDIAVNAAGGLISAGIISLLNSLPIG